MWIGDGFIFPSEALGSIVFPAIPFTFWCTEFGWDWTLLGLFFYIPDISIWRFYSTALTVLFMFRLFVQQFCASSYYIYVGLLSIPSSAYCCLNFVLSFYTIQNEILYYISILYKIKYYNTDSYKASGST